MRRTKEIIKKVSRNKIGHEKKCCFFSPWSITYCSGVTRHSVIQNDNRTHSHIHTFGAIQQMIKWLLLRQASFVPSVTIHSYILLVVLLFSVTAGVDRSMRIQSTGNETLMRQKIHKKRFILYFFRLFDRSLALTAHSSHTQWPNENTDCDDFFFRGYFFICNNMPCIGGILPVVSRRHLSFYFPRTVSVYASYFSRFFHNWFKCTYWVAVADCRGPPTTIRHSPTAKVSTFLFSLHLWNGEWMRDWHATFCVTVFGVRS